MGMGMEFNTIDPTEQGRINQDDKVRFAAVGAG